MKILNKSEFEDVINSDNDNYFSEMSIYDLRARKVKNTRYLKQNAINNFSQYSESYINQLQQLIPILDVFLSEIHLDFNLPWVFCSSNYYYEQGLPHTRGKIIFCIEGTQISTILHERIHVLQRHNPEIFEKYYIEREFKKSKQVNPLKRANPDIQSHPDYNGLIYNSEYPQRITDCNNSLPDHPNEITAYEIANLFSILNK